MGMSMDKAISWLLSITEHEGEDIPIYDTDVEAIKFAINIMHKYEKIEQILDDCDLEAWEVLEKIKEVVKDGNDN